MKRWIVPAVALSLFVLTPRARSQAPAAPKKGRPLVETRSQEVPAESVEIGDVRARVTAESLGIEPDSFAATVREVLSDLRQAARRHEEELLDLAAGSTAPGLGEAYDDHLHRACERLASFLDSTPAHELFKSRLEEWLTCLLGE